MLPEEQDILEQGYERSLAAEKPLAQQMAEFEREHGTIEMGPLEVDPTPQPDAMRSGDMQDTGGGNITPLLDAMLAVPTGPVTAVQDAFNAGKDLKNFVTNTKLTIEERKKDRFDFADHFMYQPRTALGHTAKAAAEFVTATAAVAKGLSAVGVAAPAGLAAGVAFGAGEGFLADLITTDPEDGNLAKILMDRGLKHPVLEFLATDDDDSNAEKRLKGALVGLMPGALMGGFVSALKWYKGKGAAKEILENAPKTEAKAAGTVETPGVVPGVESGVVDGLEVPPLVKEFEDAFLAGKEPTEDQIRAVADFHGMTPDDVRAKSAGIKADSKTRAKAYVEQFDATKGEVSTSAVSAAAKAEVDNKMVTLLAQDLGITPAEARKRLVVVDGKPQDFSPMTPKDGEEFLVEFKKRNKAGALETAHNVNLTNIKSAKDVKKALATLANMRADEMTDATRGVVSHEQTKKDAAELLRTDLADLLNRESGQAMSNDELLALRQLMVMSGQNLVEKAQVALKSGSDVDRAAFMQSLNAHAAIQEQVAGATAEAGRALNSLKILAGAKTQSTRNRAIKHLLQSGGGRTNVDDMMRQLESIGQSNDPVMVAKHIADWQSLSYGGRLKEGLYEARRGLMLTGVGTNVLNISSNALNIPIRVVNKKLAERVAKRAGAKPIAENLADSVAQGESMAEIQGLFGGLRDGLILAKNQIASRKRPSVEGVAKAVRGGFDDPFPMVRASEETFNRFSWGSLAPENKNTRALLETLQVDHAVNLMGSVSRVGFNVMGGADDLFKAINHRMGLHAAAHREASRLGLKGADYDARVRELLKTPVPDVSEVGLADSLKWTFNEALNGNYAKADSIVKNSALRWFMPFTRTNFNVFDYTLQHLPGVRNLSGNLIADLQAGGTRAQMAQARMQMGNMAVMLGGAMAAAGFVRGGGPQDPQTRKNIGWVPYSLKVGNSWVEIGRFHPLAKVLGMGADLFEMGADLADGDPDRHSEVLTAAAAMAAHGVTPEFLVQTLGDFVEIYDGSDNKKITAYLNRTFNPAAFTGAVRDVKKLVDPVKRDASGVAPTAYNDDAARAWDELKATLTESVPWLSKTLPAKVDMFGDEVPWEPGLSGITVATHKEDSVKEEILGLKLTDDMIANRLVPGERELALQMPPRILETRAGGSSIKRELSAQQYHDLVVLSAGKPVGKVSIGMPPLKEALAGIIAMPSYKSASDQIKRVMISKQVSAYQRAAKAKLPEVHPDLNQVLIDEAQEVGKTLMAPPTRSPQSTRKGAYPTL